MPFYRHGSAHNCRTQVQNKKMFMKTLDNPFCLNYLNRNF